jgi:hypothetical protein
MEMSGRAIQMVDKRTDKDVLRLPDPDESYVVVGRDVFINRHYLKRSPGR